MATRGGLAQPRRLSRRLVRVGAAATVLLSAGALAGFVRISFTPGGPGFRWDPPVVSWVLQARGSADVADESERAAIELAFQSWADLPGSNVSFQEDTAADASREDFTASDIHLVTWDEDGSSGLFAPGSNIIALTPILASTGDGRILDADIVFNGALAFTTDPGGATRAYDIQSVATHEIGHFIGIDHAAGPGATMFSSVRSNDPSARSLCRDERAAAATAYPEPGFAAGRISGSVVHQGAGGVRYGLVGAVDAATGEYAGGAITAQDGSFTIHGLPAGSYELYAEPADGPFQLADTIAYQDLTADEFATTWYPSNPVGVSAGGLATATWSVGAAGDMNVDDVHDGALIAGAGPQEVILFGAGLRGATGARVTGSDVPVSAVTVSVTGDVLRVTVTPSATAARGLRNVEVTGVGERVLLTAGVEVRDPAPAVTSASPTLLRAIGGDLVTIDGANFAPGSQVVIGGRRARAVEFVSSTRLRAEAPAASRVGEALDVVVLRPDGAEARLAGVVRYELVPLPEAIDPAVGPSAGGTDHRITGQGFGSGLRVFFGDAEADVLSVTPTEVRVIAPPHAEGVVDVTLDSGSASGTLSGSFSYVAGTPPRVSAFSPANGPTSGGTEVTIDGSGFDPDAQVAFGDLLVTVTEASSTRLVVVTPPHAAGAVDLRVTNPSSGLEDLAEPGFSYVELAAATAPASGSGSSSSGGCALATPGARPSPELGAQLPTGLAVWLGLLALLLLRGAGRAGAASAPSR